MQKVLRRTHLAKAQKKRKDRIAEALVEKRDRRVYIQVKKGYDGEKADARRDAIRATREDWHLGPLAPWRAAMGLEEIEAPRGASPGTVGPLRNASYGAYSMHQGTQPVLPKSRWLEESRLKLRVGDRVCVVQGGERVKGRIGTLKEIHLKEGTATVKNIGMVSAKPLIMLATTIESALWGLGR